MVGRLSMLAVTLSLGIAGIAAGSAHATPTPTPTDAAPTEPAAERIECASALSVEEQAAQTLLALVSTPDQLVEMTDLISQRLISGVVPVGDVVATAAWDANTFETVAAGLDRFDIPALLASDEEGGVVQRFDDVFGPIPSARRQVETMSPAEVTDMYATYGAQLATFDVSMAFAPVVDIGGGPAIGSRSYGSDPAIVVEYARAAIDGYLTAGITPVVKHFPGHGRAGADTHDGPAATPPLDELRQLDLVPYAALLDDDVAVMVGHLDVPDLTDGLPASLSSAAIDGLLRGEFGFDGLVVSDALGMGAVRQVATGPDAAVMFLQAGGDLALIDAVDAVETHLAMVDAVMSGRLEPLRLQQAAAHVLVAKGVAGTCAPPWALMALAIARSTAMPAES